MTRNIAKRTAAKFRTWKGAWMYYACEEGSRFDAQFPHFSTFSSTKISRARFSLDKSNTYLVGHPSHNLKVAKRTICSRGEYADDSPRWNRLIRQNR